MLKEVNLSRVVEYPYYRLVEDMIMKVFYTRKI